MTNGDPATETVRFTAMEHGTREDYLLLDRHERRFAANVADRVLQALVALDGSMGGYQVSRLTHSLQTATRAAKDGADDDLVAAALLHDLGDVLAPYNHAEFAASILRPYVRPEVTWIVEQHGLVQSYYYAHHLGGDRNARDRIADHPWYPGCVHFCARWDQASFNPGYATRELAWFEPVVRRVLSRAPYDPRYASDGSSERQSGQAPG